MSWSLWGFRELLVLAALCGARSAAAQSADLVVLPVVHNGERADALTQLAQDVEDEAARSHIATVSRDVAAERMEQSHAQQPRALPPSVVDEIGQEAHAAAIAMVNDRASTTILHLQRIRELAEQHLDSINSNDRARQALLESCVVGVQAHLQEHQVARANALGSWCLGTLPTLNPAKAKLPAAVRAVFAAAQEEIEAAHTRPLSIRTQPPGCTLLVQGAAIGTTPYVLEHGANRPYAIQALCGEGMASRVYRVSPAERSVLEIDVPFDRAVHSTPDLQLRYQEALDERKVRSHALRVAKIVGADMALALYAPRPDRFTLHRISASHGARIDLPAPYTTEQLRRAIERVLHGDDQVVGGDGDGEDDEAAPAPPPAIDDAVPASPAEATREQAPSRHRAAAWPLWTGGILAGAGAAGFVTSGLLLRTRFQDGRKLIADTTLARQRRWTDDRTGPRIAGGLAASALSAGAILLADRLDPTRHRWLPVSAAVLGAGFVVGGAIAVAGHEKCTSTSTPTLGCINAEHRTDRGTQWLFAAVPLLSFSTAQFVRWMMPPATITASVAGGRTTIWLRANF